ncbi:centrosomal protein of 112 kDa isoform X2 [Bufo gargarizans]|uniref:centrosomal protein of 112 kDa isoform X1 n=1 Tax=Bufo gargarizans TaxID=30331 RepID=UPI001CF3EBFA|nr:centrosomal protein of 112 kDa isoform X1 [Bufo gargarizans]XP_044129670.1 centrosomal protein of 112 kDa isoform X2 [Bufo gargarizans]
MSSQEETWETLDAEFDHYLVDMKPYVLKLPQRLDRQRCALWIRKLCEPSGAGSGVTGRKNRNLHAKLLLHMLKRGVLEGPFTHKPEDGTLKTLPTYMSIYFDEPMAPRSHPAGSGRLPDWVQGELESNPEESCRLSRREGPVSSPDRLQQPYGRTLVRRSLSPTRRSEDDTLEPLRTGDRSKRLATSHDDSDLDAVLNSWNLGIENPRYLRDKPLPLTPISPDSRLGRSADYRDERSLFRLHKSELDMKIKSLEAKFHEEKLKMQQKHDGDVQKILERKNNEIEEMKGLYRVKQNEAEETVRKLEKKVQTLLRESQLIRETKDAQIHELKKLCEESAETQRNQWEKKLHSAVADMEQEKFELQRRHTENIQELLDDTNTRLLKMETDYMAQTKATAQTVKELDARVQQLTVEAESSSLQRQKLSQEKAEVEASYQAARSEVQQLSARLTALQNERDRLSQDYDKQLQQLHGKHESDVHYITQQNALSAAQASTLIEELEQSLSRSKQQGQEREHQLQQEMRERESRFQKEKLQTERQWERKVHDLQKKLEEERESSAKKIAKMADLLKEREEQLSRMTEMQRLQAEATEEFKRQVERNTEKVYGGMKQQMEKVEADLNRSKSLREKQSQEFSRQLQEVTRGYEQQMVELKLEHEQEKSHLHQQHSAERDRLVKDHEQEIHRLEGQLQNAMSEHEKKMQAWRERDAQTISDLENHVYKMKEELIQINAQHKQQLLELGHLRDEEKQRTAQEHHKALSRLRAEMESARLDLQRTHAAQTQETLEKAGNRLMQMEKEYGEKLAKTAQVVSDLQATMASMREESGCQQLEAERRLQEAEQKHQEEKRQLTREREKATKLLQDEASGYCSQLRLSERRLQDKELELQEQIAHIRQEYELKIRGLMPAAMRHELEDTITSLKSQVNFLQKRAQVLQDDLTFHQSIR